VAVVLHTEMEAKMESLAVLVVEELSGLEVIGVVIQSKEILVVHQHFMDLLGVVAMLGISLKLVAVVALAQKVKQVKTVLALALEE
jgi:hypothetical protein